MIQFDQFSKLPNFISTSVVFSVLKLFILLFIIKCHFPLDSTQIIVLYILQSQKLKNQFQCYWGFNLQLCL